MPVSLHRRVSSRALVPGGYLTDGRRLLRVASRFDDGRSVMVLVEDCRTFAAHAYAAVELRAMGFRRVRIAGAR
jgi:anti-sigma factor ChrR (cupin superfamily)